MKETLRSIRTAMICFLIVLILNFLLPRMLPGDPVAYLTGFAEEDMTPAQVEYYRTALHLDESGFRQFLWYLRSLLDGTLGFSYKKNAVVSTLIGERLGYTLQITLPAVVLSTLLGLGWGLRCGTKKGSAGDSVSTSALIVLNAVPTFVLALVLMIFCCFTHKWLPYTGLNDPGVTPGTRAYALDRLRHLLLPVLTLTLSTAPSRYLLMRNTAATAADEKYVLYARERGISERKIRYRYVFPNIAQPFLTMVGMSVSTCVGGSLVLENIFSIPGMGTLLTEAVYSLDYPLMQGILAVTTLIMVVAIIVTDVLCVLIDPKLRKGGNG